MLRLRVHLFVCAALAGASVGCAFDAHQPRLWAVSDMVHLTDRTPAADRTDVWDAEAATIGLFSGLNETVGFQLVVDAPRQGLSEVEVVVGRLTGPGGRKLSPDCVKLFRMLPVSIREYPAWFLRLADGPVEPAGYYDALVPIRPPTATRFGLPKPGQLFDLTGGERLAIWVDVSVPPTAVAGEYRAPVTVRHDDGRRRATLVLKVYDVVLPNARPVVCLGGFSHETIFRQFVRRRTGAAGRTVPYVPSRLDTSNPDVRKGLVIIRELMRLGHDHRVDLFDKTIHPLLKRDRSGAVQLRWKDYDSIVKPYLDGTAFADRIGVAAWPMPLWAGWPRPDSYGGADSDAYRRTLSAVAAQAARHFEALGAKGKLFFWPRPERTGPAGYRRHMALAQVLRAQAADVPILSELPARPPAETIWAVPEDFAKLADMYAPPANLAALSQAGALARRDHPMPGLWLRPGRPPYVGSCGVLASPADVRALGWLAVKYRCAGIFLPEVLGWAGDAQAPGAGEGRLFYPGERFGLKAALPTVRLKWLRRGLQDAAYLWLLTQRQRRAVAETMIDSMVRYAGLDATGDHYQDPRLDGWVREGGVWWAAQRLLTQETFAAVHASNVSSRELLAQRLAWRKLTQRTGRLRVERIRSRVMPRGEGHFALRLRLELYNEFTRSVDAAVSVESLPPGWRSAQPAKRLAALAAGKPATVEFAAEGDHAPIDTDGKIRIPLLLTTDLGQRERLVAEVPLVLAGWCGRKLTVDGDLSDWPLRPGNRAGGFKLLGRRQRAGDGRARRQTAVFALHDRENLYLAFRCREPDLARIRARPNNIIRYDQLMANGEDLVEVILDPTGKAQTAEDLYHLIVKCNGVILAERGVNTDPPLGRARPWPVSAKVAIGKGDRLWIVELAIPLAAFEATAPDGFWRVNFTRFATAGSEASSFSGAARYFYHPENLGTMVLVPEGGRIRLATTRPARE